MRMRPSVLVLPGRCITVREAPGRYFFPPKKQPAEKKLGAIVRAAAEVLIVSAVAPLATRAAEAWLTAVVNAPDVLRAARGACGDGVLPISLCSE